MKQQERINKFIAELLDSQLSEKQIAIAFREGNAKKETYKNDYKCKNEQAEACSSNFKKCTNYSGRCIKSANTMECNNTSEPIPGK